MAQCVGRTEKRPSNAEIKAAIIDLDEMSTKKFKQARLPFQPLDCKTPALCLSGSKKRKLSGQDSPKSKAKLSKHSTSESNLQTDKQKPVILDKDNEVSSSSEAEHVPGSTGKNCKNNILERFVRRSSLQEEITSTNDVVDLTLDSQDGNVQCDENSPVKVCSPTKSAQKSQRQIQGKCVDNQEKSEDGFARKLVFDEENTKSPVPQMAFVNGDSCKTVVSGPRSLEEKDSAQMDKINTDNQNRIAHNNSTDCENHDACNETEMIDLSREEDDDTDASVKNTDVTTPHKLQSSETMCIDDLSGGQTPLSCSTPQTPASVNTSCSSLDGSTPRSTKRYGRPSSTRQAEKIALRQRVKEEKEKQKQEAKEQREKERLEKKQKRDEEKAEKEKQKQMEKEQKEKERLEKKEQIEREKQEKLSRREEEKKKKQEILDAKLEEKKKKEEEKRLKEEEKLKEQEEKEKQKLKRKEVFQSFFIKPKAVTTTKVQKAADSIFIPFEVKKDMSLAPGHRRPALTDQEKEQVDSALAGQEGVMYVDCLKKGIVKPVRTGRKLRTKKTSEQEVELIIHDSETVKKVMHAVKILQFHTDYRPPYYGTWRKQVHHISPRNPWKKDEDIFDYDVDSDEEWEEEEPGESLSDSNDEEEEVEGGDEEEDDGWMVPHGYLSEDEGCDDDEEVTPEVLKARQRAKAQAWEAELQAKKQVAPPVHLGCYWKDDTSIPQPDLDILRQFEMVCLRRFPLETQLSSPPASDNGGERNQDRSGGGATPGTKGARKRAVPEEAIPHLIRLLHGNPFGIKKLVREFRLFWKRKTASPNTSLSESCMEEEEEAMDTSCADISVTAEQSQHDTSQTEEKKSTKEDATEVIITCKMEEEVTDKTEEMRDQANADEADDNFCISKRQLEIKILAIAAREKRPGNNRKCWYVNVDTLKQYNLVDLSVENGWEYVSCDLTKKTPCKSTEKVNKGAEKKANVADTKASQSGKGNTGQETPVADKARRVGAAKTPRDQPSIKGFTSKTPPVNLLAEPNSQAKPSSIEHSTKAQVKPDQPSVMDFMKRKLAVKAVGNGIRDVCEEKQERQAVQDDCIVLD